MYQFYISTIKKKWSYNYLSKDFFIKLPQYLNKESILILAKKIKILLPVLLILFLIIYFMEDTGEVILI